MFTSSVRKKEPTHYMLKIESFSILSEDTTMKIESDVFEASGHKWRLDLYPNGNEEEDGDYHISLYVIICDTENYSKDWEVCVDINIFAYNHIRRNYVLFQDFEGNRTRFNEKKTKWGLPKLILVESFKESENGYLRNDSCVFGVEVFAVTEHAQKDRCLSMTKPQAFMNTYTWTIDNFSSITKKVLYSEIFKVEKVKWRLKVYPKGEREDGKCLSIYLSVPDADLLPDGWKVYASYKLRVKKQSDKVYEEKETNDWFSDGSSAWGYPNFIQLRELDCMLSESLIVEAEFSIVGILKNFI